MKVILTATVLSLAMLFPAAVQGQETNEKNVAQNEPTVETLATEVALMTPPKVMRDYQGVRLDMKAEEVRSIMGDPERSDKAWDEFKLNKRDLMTVRYNNGMVNAIQLYFTDAERAPDFVDVVGDIELTPKDNGAMFAKRMIESESFYVSMYQSGDKKVTTVSLGRQQ